MTTCTLTVNSFALPYLPSAPHLGDFEELEVLVTPAGLLHNCRQAEQGVLVQGREPLVRDQISLRLRRARGKSRGRTTTWDR